MSPFGLAGLQEGITAACLGLLVFFKGTNKKIVRVWSLFIFTVIVWGFGTYLVSTAITLNEGRLIWACIYTLSVPWMAATFFHFICVFLEADHRLLIRINYLIALAFAILIGIKGSFYVEWMFDSLFYIRGGAIYIAHLIWWMACVFYSHYLLFTAYRKVTPEKKQQIKYFFLATGIGFTGGSMCYLPSFGLKIYPYGNFATCFYPFIMTYAILKHQLMDVRVVIRKTVLSAVGLLIAVAGYILFVSQFMRREIMPLANVSISTAILSAVMALLVFYKAPKRKITVLWALTCLSIASWCLGFGMMTRSAGFEECLFWQKWFIYTGSTLIPVLYLHFVSLLVGFDIKRVLTVSYLCAFVFEGLNFAGLLATATIKPPFNFYTHAIFPSYHLFTLYFFTLACYAHWLLLKRLKTAEGALRNQIQYVFCGTAIGFLGGSMTFPLSFNIHVFPIGVYLVAFYLIAITYSMYKHHLMDISLVLRKSVVYSVMTAILTAIYLVVVTQGSHVLQSLFGASTLTISIMTACLISAIFLPLRDKVQSVVDEYFFPMWSDREVVREVAAGFSHELKSPLAGLSMQAQMTLSELEEIEKDPKALEAALPRIKEELQYLVNKSMEAARRIEAVRGVAEPVASQIESVYIPTVLDNSLTALKPLLTQVSPDVRRLIPGNLPPVRSNLKQLEIVFINLMKNALEAMDGLKTAERHVLALNGSEQDSSVFVSVKDTGAGIAERDIGHVFDPHYSTKGRRGMGMGLFLSHQIVQAYGGSIEVRSAEGKGTEFIVRLPKFEAARAA